MGSAISFYGTKMEVFNVVVRDQLFNNSRGNSDRQKIPHK